MRGRNVERRFGWDCHGLPAEVEAEKPARHQKRGTGEILEIGIETFNAACRESPCCATPTNGASATSPARRAGSTSTTTTRRSTLSYMESVMWAFKTLWDKGLVYEGFSACWPTAGAARRRCQQHRDAHGRRLPRPPGPGAHRRRSAGDRDRAASSSGLDDDPVDPAVEPRRRRRPRDRLRGRGGRGGTSGT